MESVLLFNATADKKAMEASQVNNYSYEKNTPIRDNRPNTANNYSAIDYPLLTEAGVNVQPASFNGTPKEESLAISSEAVVFTTDAIADQNDISGNLIEAEAKHSIQQDQEIALSKQKTEKVQAAAMEHEKDLFLQKIVALEARAQDDSVSLKTAEKKIVCIRETHNVEVEALRAENNTVVEALNFERVKLGWNGLGWIGVCIGIFFLVTTQAILATTIPVYLHSTHIWNEAQIMNVFDQSMRYVW